MEEGAWEKFMNGMNWWKTALLTAWELCVRECVLKREGGSVSKSICIGWVMNGVMWFAEAVKKVPG